MASKHKNNFACKQCGNEFSKWQGQCSACQEWNCIIELPQSMLSTAPAAKTGYTGQQSQLTSLRDVSMKTHQRLSTSLKEFDHVLGGGLVSDAVILIGGDPGIGKSTLILQVVSALSQSHGVLYVSGEESLQQIAMRAKRLGLQPKHFNLLTETCVKRIIEITNTAKAKILVVDSIQTLFNETVNSAPGSVSQVRESAALLVRYAKQSGIALMIVGHVTKEGAIAGPRVLEHMVDTVLYFEGQSDHRFRVIRAVKNRFGAVNELGVFAMTEQGLKQVDNPSAIFLSGCAQETPGTSVMVTWEGSRSLLVQVQALVDESHLGNPRRVTVGLEQNRLAMLLAVLHRHGGIATYDQDVFVNVVGGLRVSETAADLAQLMAVVSSLKNKILPKNWMVFGEIGLSGEIRPVAHGQERIKEAAKHGFTDAIVPMMNVPKQKTTGITVHGVATVQEAISKIM